MMSKILECKAMLENYQSNLFHRFSLAGHFKQSAGSTKKGGAYTKKCCSSDWNRLDINHELFSYQKQLPICRMYKKFPYSFRGSNRKWVKNIWKDTQKLAICSYIRKY